MPETHSRLAPSAAHRWIHCPAALAMEQFEPGETSSYAEEGTAAHALAERVLQNRLSPYLTAALKKQGTAMVGGQETSSYLETYPLARPDHANAGPQVNQEMVDHIGEYVEAVWTRAQQPGALLMVEQRCDFSHIVGIPNQSGTADAVIVVGDELEIHDLKYGFNRIDAFENPQLMLYALGALAHVSLITDIRRVRLFIHQPRIHHFSEYECSINNLNEFGQNAKIIAAEVLRLADQAALEGPESIPPSAFHPGEETCQWCRRRGKCRAQAEYLSASMLNDFDRAESTVPLQEALQTAQQKLIHADSLYLGEMLPLVGYVEDWCRGVRTAAFSLLQQGHPVPGYKLVQGKQGNRVWADESAAEAALKAMRVSTDQRYIQKIISPKQAERLLKKDRPRQWLKMETLMTRAEGKPTLVPESDPRPAWTISPLNDFDNTEAEESLI